MKDQRRSTSVASPLGEALHGSGGRPLIVGEVLFDVMPNGNRVLGGAPFNVAWHLAAFGLRPLMITRVGADDSGDAVIAAMESWSMDTWGVQRDPARRTGEVRVDLDGGEPSFHVLPDQAYDHLDGDLATRATRRQAISLLYHGTLIARDEDSRTALVRLRHEVGAPIFVDVNLRDPWWNRQDVVADLSCAKWVKVNEEELRLLVGGPPGAETAEAFRTTQGLEMVIVTRGEHGAVVAHHQGTVRAQPPGTVEIVDTVGAGDAFSAVFILGLTKGWPVEQTLQRALGFAAAMCAVPGATVSDRGFYAAFRERGWW